MNAKRLQTSLLAISCALGLCLGSTYAAAEDAAVPQAKSDGLRATVTDTVITTKIKSRLMAKKRLDHSTIGVTTTNGVVTLQGAADSDENRELAESVAKSVSGVKSVDNSLTVSTDNTTLTKTKRIVSDSWITTQVKSAMLADSPAKAMDVSVRTRQGVVILKGVLADQDAIDHVKALAAKVEGVKSVDIESLTIAAR